MCTCEHQSFSFLLPLPYMLMARYAYAHTLSHTHGLLTNAKVTAFTQPPDVVAKISDRRHPI